MNVSHPRHARRNFILFLADFILFGVATGLIGASTVIPDFVRHLTNSEALIGLSGSLYNFAWLLPQLAVAQFVNRRATRKPFLNAAPFFRLTVGGVAILIALIGNSNLTLVLLVFLFGYSLFAATDGLLSLAWGDTLGSTLRPQTRSNMFAIGQVVQAVAVFGTREVIRHVLGPSGPVFPNNYALLMFMAGIIYVVAGICLALTVEEQHDEPMEPGPSLNEYVPYLGNVLRTDKAFRRFVLTRLLYDISLMAVPFYIIFGTDVLKLPHESIVGDSILLITLGNAGASLLMGWFSRRSGSRAVIRLLGFIQIALPGLALLSVVLGQAALYATFIMLGGVSAAVAPGYLDWVITHAPPNRRPIYMGLSNTIFSASNLSPLIGGIVLSLTSYPVLFGLSIIIALAGLRMSFTIAEPRDRIMPSKILDSGLDPVH